MTKTLATLTAFAIAVFASAGPRVGTAQSGNAGDSLAGAWRGKIQFTSGAFAGIKDLEYMYAFAAGGTMTESSNYDGAPPVPPAYGIWKKIGARKYEAKYQYYQTKAVTSAEELVKIGGWAPDGYGTFTQKITLSADGNSFDSTITLEMFDKEGKATAGGGEGTASATRLRF
jgi:hypothetical protein